MQEYSCGLEEGDGNLFMLGDKKIKSPSKTLKSKIVVMRFKVDK